MKIKIGVIILFSCCCLTSCNSQQKSGGAIIRVDSNAVYTYHKASADGIGKFYMGREIAHVMGAAGSDWLERSDRNQEENTNLAIEKISLAPNSVVADIGAGTGYYS